MKCLVETSVLVRLANADDIDYQTADDAVTALGLRGAELRSAPQNFIEFRSVVTRPANVNGLGLSSADAEALAATFEASFPLLPDTPDIFPAWKTLVAASGCIGRQVHDARLVAVCLVHQISHILTFNTRHFVRLAALAPSLNILDPAAV